ncbi:hypothetical protein FYZ48_25230 [Gimesia chilikensis]|uniref:dockerin type I domain-containing protein n=1 Tax=Gimesia chilikensis TaxID=2605989 RepID=UPI0011EBAD77|nr:dockerin type I domain-containing protein [Gimesia chilikensis]KAA0131452.1 hypothetical protein FYZ48_25230 [Gimesia chilikensis]
MKNNQRRFETLSRLTRRLHQSLFARPRRRSAARAQQQRFQPANCQIELLEERRLLTAAFSELNNPNPSADTSFGSSVVSLSTGNIVVTDPSYDGSRGAVYLFNGQTGDLISTLTGASANDRIGNGRVTSLPNGNFVVSSPSWSNGETGGNAGAVTFGNGITGVSGVVSAANSLVGSFEYDGSGGGRVIVLENGNYVVTNPYWDNGSIADVGAVTFGDATTGVTGVISEANSLIGASAQDKIGYHYGNDTGIKLLANGNYLVGSPFWDNGSNSDAGALTWGNGTTGTTGVVSSANSLVGSSQDDLVGDFLWGNVNITLLANGNYVLCSPTWDNGSITDAGAVTFGDGTTGVTGAISAANSLVGTTAGDKVGSLFHSVSSVTELTNGNYVVSSPTWDNGSILDAGAVTFGSGTTGVSGVISSTNSLVGATQEDFLGRRGINTNGITALTNGNFVVSSPVWDNGSVINAGAVTFGDGTTGVSGVISDSNSLVGLIQFDQVGYSGATALTNGNYVISTPTWSDGLTRRSVGAVTFGDGMVGINGTISSDNSLIGSSNNDYVGNGGVVALPNGNYVAISNVWSFDKGAVSFGNGTTGLTGVLSASNSLVGTENGSFVGKGGVTVLANGNYVVVSSGWGDASFDNLGAVTWGSGTTGVTGAVSASNSFVGTKEDDHVGSDGIVALTNGNYVISSSQWDNGTIIDAGAVTFGDGTSGGMGLVSSTNSLVGSTADDRLGYHYYSNRIVTPLANGNYVVVSTDWDNGSIVDAGAVTFGDGTTGITGEITSTNSLIGAHEDDQLGGYQSGVSEVTALPNGNYLVVSRNWDNGLIDQGSGVTFGDGTIGVTGYITSSNSVASEQGTGSYVQRIRDDVNQSFLVVYGDENTIWVGSQINGFTGTTFDLIEDVVLAENASEQSIDLTGLEPVTEGPVIWSASSDNPDFIPDSSLTVLDEGGTPRLRLVPPTGRTGTAQITVQVEDGGLDQNLATTEDNGTFRRTFTLTINGIEESAEEFLALRVVETPTSVDANGEASVLPANETWVGEWSEYWVEIWVHTENVDSGGVALVDVDLSYFTVATTAVEIQFGAAFTQNQSGTIFDHNGGISQLAASTETPGLGINKQLLFARVRFAALEQDEVAVGVEETGLGSEMLSFGFFDSFIGLGNGQGGKPLNVENASSTIWANPYDLNDDGQISFQDLLRFASVYGAVPNESDSDYAWLADLNQDGRVNFRDLVLFAGNYGKNKLQKVRPTPVHYPDNYPYGWNQQLQATSQPVAVSTAAALTQSEADVMRESAVEDLSPRLSSAAQQKLEAVQIEVVDLAGTTLGQVVGDTIYLDINAAGHGWFIDATPRDHNEFQSDSSLSLIASPGSEAAGLIDLWTVIHHELGHLLGNEHAEEGVMESTLATGERKLPDWNTETDDFFASLNADSDLLAF